MQILYLITKPERGGAQTHVRDLALGLSDHEITIGTGRTGWLTEELNSPPIIFKYLNRSLNPLAAVFYILELRQHIKHHHYDILHFHSSNALFGILATLGLNSKPKTIATIHGLSILHPGWQKFRPVKKLYAQVMKFLLKYFDRVIFVCRADQKYALNMKLVQPEQARMIYNGINPNIHFFSRSQAREQLALPNNLFVAGTVARLEYSKQLELLIAAADQMRNHQILFVVLGDGPDREELVKLIDRRQLTDKVLLLNCFPNPKQLIKAFDCFLITSRYEGLPYTLLEAGLAELPVISTDVGGINEVVEQTYPADPDFLARRILALKQSRVTCHPERSEGSSLPNNEDSSAYGLRMTSHASTEVKKTRQKIITQFSQDKMIQNISSLYDETLA